MNNPAFLPILADGHRPHPSRLLLELPAEEQRLSCTLFARSNQRKPAREAKGAPQCFGMVLPAMHAIDSFASSRPLTANVGGSFWPVTLR
jgi:hypothetical protein